MNTRKAASSKLEFSEVFKLVFEYSFSDETRSKPVVIPFDGPVRKCVFCNPQETPTSFRKKSHIIPEGLGNKYLLFRNECDVHNEQNGKSLDQELINDLAALRALSRRRGHGLKQKYKYGESESYIEGNSVSNSLQIHIDETDDTIRCEYDEKNHLTKYFVKSPPVNKVSVAKSIARMAIMCLPYLEIKKQEHLVRWVKGKLQFLPIYYRGFIPGAGLVNTTLAVFQNKEHIVGCGEFFVLFTYSNIFYYVHLPTTAMIIPKHVLLPPPSIFGIHPSLIQVKRITCSQDIKTRPAEELYVMRYVQKKQVFPPL